MFWLYRDTSMDQNMPIKSESQVGGVLKNPNSFHDPPEKRSWYNEAAGSR